LPLVTQILSHSTVSGINLELKKKGPVELMTSQSQGSGCAIVTWGVLISSAIHIIPCSGAQIATISHTQTVSNIQSRLSSVDFAFPTQPLHPNCGLKVRRKAVSGLPPMTRVHVETVLDRVM
jgi:hypothetical protein